MSELERLIEELCPNGVKYVKVGDVAEVGTGSSNGNEAIDDGKYPFFVRSQIVKAKDDYEYDEEAIIIPGEGGIGEIFHYINGKYALHQRVYRIHFITYDVDVKFAYYYMQANFKAFIMKKAVSATVTSIRKPMVEEFPLPVPPIEVQREIVRVLDNFTELTTELTTALTTEFTARQKQYEYYQEKLLTFDDDVEQVKLSELFNTRNGYTPSKSNVSYWENGVIPWFRMEDIRTNGRILCDSIQKVSMEAVKGKLFPANSFIVATSATIGEHALLTCESLANQRFTYLMLKEDYKERFDIKFLYYYCFKLDEYCKQHLNQGNFASVDMGKFNEFRFPLIPIEKQKYIAETLDRFDSLCNDIFSGLPAEIEARQKQYEYYRDKLLTFKELSV